jgi:hypothetical protein
MDQSINLREYFAGQIAPVFLKHYLENGISKDDESSSGNWREILAYEAFQIADIMCAMRHARPAECVESKEDEES